MIAGAYTLAIAVVLAILFIPLLGGSTILAIVLIMAVPTFLAGAMCLNSFRRHGEAGMTRTNAMWSGAWTVFVASVLIGVELLLIILIESKRPMDGIAAAWFVPFAVNVYLGVLLYPVGVIASLVYHLKISPKLSRKGPV